MDRAIAMLLSLHGMALRLEQLGNGLYLVGSVHIDEHNELEEILCVPNGIRTRVSGVKSRGPGPLDDGDVGP